MYQELSFIDNVWIRIYQIKKISITFIDIFSTNQLLISLLSVNFIMVVCDYIPRTSTCCWYFDLIRGSSLLAIYYFYEATFFGGYSFSQLNHFHWDDPEDLSQHNLLLIIACLALIQFTLAILLTMAIWLERSRIVFGYLYIRCFSLFIHLILIISTFAENFQHSTILVVSMITSFCKHFNTELH